MTPPTRIMQSSLQTNHCNKRWIPAVIFLSLLLLIVKVVTPVASSTTPVPGMVLLASNPTPTTGSTSAITSRTALPNAATATPTRTSQPTGLISTLGTTVMVIRDDINLRDGPGVQYPVVQKMMMGDQLVVLGRMADNIWLYVKTTDGRKGWIKTVLVNTAGMNMNDHPIKTPSPSPNTTVMVAGDRVYLRAGPGTFFSTIQKLIYGDSLMLLGKMDDNSWLYVKTTDGQEGWIKTRWVNLAGLNLDYNYVPIATSPPTETSTPVILPGIEGRWIDVDLSEQMLFAYEGTERVASFLVSTGTAPYPTEQREYRIYVKYLFSDMHGSDYFLPDVPFTMYYSGDFSIHGTYWHHNFGTPMSHGCINMDTSEAEWLYNWASVGTIVNIHR